jgi:hypothetical protein
MNNFSGYSSARFVPLVREASNWSAWPDDPSSLVPNWQVYQVAFDRPGGQRVTALWNGDGSDLRVRIPKNGASAQLIDRQGNATPLQDNQGWWVVNLPGATAHFPLDPDGYHFIGGDPLLLVENGVDPSAPVVAPSLGEPGSVARDFKTFVNPQDGQTVGQGQPADFFVDVRGYEGFSDPVTFSITSWSTQRFPDPKDGSSLPLAFSAPGSIQPGNTATLHFETAGADPGIYYITVQATGGSSSHTIDLALVVN